MARIENMNIARCSRLAKMISVILIISFIAFDISWAHPANTSESHTLATQNLFQQNMMTADGAVRQSAVFADMRLLASVRSIGKALLEQKLPLKFLESTLVSELGNVLIGGMDLSNVMMKGDVVLVPYINDGSRYIIQISLRTSPSATTLKGYDWPLIDKDSDRYIIKVLVNDDASGDDLKRAQEEYDSAKAALVPEAQGLLDFLDGRSYKPGIGTPDFSPDKDFNPLVLALGSPSPEAFVAAAKRWHKFSAEWGMDIPVLASGGHGRGTDSFIENTQYYYDNANRPMDAEAFRRLRSKAGKDKLTEAEVIKFIFNHEGVQGVIYLETDSTDTLHSLEAIIDNVIMKDVIKYQDSDKPLKIAVVADAFHQLRVQLTALGLYKHGHPEIVPAKHNLTDPKNANRKRVDWQIVSVPFHQPFLTEMDDDKLLGAGNRLGYLMNYIGDPDKPGDYGEVWRYIAYGMLDFEDPGYAELRGYIEKNWSEEKLKNLRDNLLKRFIGAKQDLIRAEIKKTDASNTYVNNERAEIVSSANKLLETIARSELPESSADIVPIDRLKTTIEVKNGIENVISAIESLDKKAVSEEAVTAVGNIKVKIDKLEADGVIASVITLARKAMFSGQKLIIGLDTDWIPGYNEEKSRQKEVMNSIVREIEDLPAILRSMGLDNVVMIHASSSELASNIIAEADRTQTSLSNVVILASKDTVTSASFAVLRSTPDEAKAFIAGIDPVELQKLFDGNEGSINTLNIKILEMLSIALDLASGKEPPNIPMITSYEKALRIVMLLPKAEPKDYEELKRSYFAQQTALAAA